MEITGMSTLLLDNAHLNGLSGRDVKANVLYAVTVVTVIIPLASQQFVNQSMRLT